MERATVVALSAGLAAVFLVAAVPKLRQPRRFLFTVLAYGVLPDAAARVYAGLVPPLELLIALLLVSGVAVRTAAVLVVGLLGTFIVAISVNLVRGRTLDCECFGGMRRRTIGWPVLLEDVVFLAAAGALWWETPAWFSAEPWSMFRLILPFAPSRHGLPTGDIGSLVICVGLVGVIAVALRRRAAGGQ